MINAKILRGFCAGLTTIVLLCGTLTAMPVFAEKDTFTDEVLTYTKIGDGVSITACKATATSFHLPDSIDGYPILEIGDNAFAGCEKLTDIDISRTKIRSIGQNAFAGCTMLKEIVFPDDTLKTIGMGAFAYCNALEAIVLPNSVTEIGAFTFAYCLALDSVKLSDAIETLPNSVFYYDYELSELKMPKNLKKIEAFCTIGCFDLKTISIPASVTEIEEQAFLETTGVTEFNVDANNPAFSKGAEGALYSKDGSVLLAYPANNGETECTLPDTVKEIAAYAFAGSISLRQITLPASVNALPVGCFSNCLSLKKLVCDDALLRQLPEGVFAGCTSLETLTLPTDCTAIGNYAFYGCSKITDFLIPESVTEIGKFAFCGCDSLTELRVPKTVTTIGTYAIGFTLPASIENGEEEAAPAVQKNFVLHGYTPSEAKKYAAQSGVKFKSTNFPIKLLLIIVAGVCLILLAILCIRDWIKKKKARAAEQTQDMEHPEETESEQYFDENYQSILMDETEEAPVEDTENIENTEK